MQLPSREDRVHSSTLDSSRTLPGQLCSIRTFWALRSRRMSNSAASSHEVSYELSGCLSPVADAVLLLIRELSHGPPQAWEENDRVESETAASRRCLRDAAATGSLEGVLL